MCVCVEASVNNIHRKKNKKEIAAPKNFQICLKTQGVFKDMDGLFFFGRGKGRRRCDAHDIQPLPNCFFFCSCFFKQYFNFGAFILLFKIKEQCRVREHAALRSKETSCKST